MTTSAFLSIAAMLAVGLTIGLASGDTGAGNKGGGTVAAESPYDFTVKNIDGSDVHLAKYKGLVCLVVNVASR